MTLPSRQQRVLDQIEQALQAADPWLKSMFAAFGRFTGPVEVSAEMIGAKMPRRAVLIPVIAVTVIVTLLVVVLPATAKACPRLASDQVVASAAVRLAACTDTTAAWSKGGR